MSAARRLMILPVIASVLALASPAGAQDADTERPSVPSSRIVVGSIGETEVSVSWGAATDNVGVTGYNIYINGELFVTSPENNREINGLSRGTDYEIYVRAYDAAGNVGWRSGIKTFTTLDPPDTERPSVVSRAIRLEPNGRFINWGQAYDNRSVKNYILFDADTNEIFGETNGLRYEMPEGPGTYRLYVKAEDAAGNRSYRSGIANLAISGDPDRPSIPGAISYTRDGDTVSLAWAASTDNIGVVEYRLYDSATRTVLASSPTNSIELIDAQALSVFVKAVDAAGNESYRNGIRSIPAA